MDQLPLKSLLLARLVCRKWNAMATTKVANKSGPIQLEVYQPWKPSRGIKVSIFIDVMRNSMLGCPFSKYSISSFHALEELDRFFFHFGRTIKHLDLNLPEGFDDTQAFITLLIRKIPHLESLRIGCCQMFKQMYLIGRPNDVPESLPFGKKVYLGCLRTFCVGNIINMIPSKSWLEAFFKMTPNLEKLVLHVNFKENGNTFIRIVLEALMNHDGLKNIRSLMISCLTESHLRTLIKLAECGLRLKKFRFQDLCIHLTEINGSTLETFLASQADNLESLEIDQSSNFPRIRPFQLPPMKSLKTLSVVSSQRISLGILNYSSHLPKLEKLTLRGYDVFSSSNVFPHSDGAKRSIAGQFLTVLSLPSKLNIPHFPKVLASMFPNVADLEVRGVTNECLKEIWESWPRLEKLKLVVSHFDDNIDSGLTGIPDEVCAELRNEPNSENDCGTENVKTATGITDLKYLRSFEMECRAMWIPCQIITDVAGYFALAKMTSLRKLKVTEIGVPEKFDLSNECIQNIIKTLKHTEVTFKIMDDHGRWQLELGRADILRNTYESEPQLEDHNKDKEYVVDDHSYAY
ncbi:unnamed protein product [Orchesella dallaii]